MRKTKLIFFLSAFFAHSAYSQYQAANWYLSHSFFVLKITPGNFERDSLPHAPGGFAANSSIGDLQGNLLFFSTGIDARDKNGNLMDSGCCLCESIDFPSSCIANQNGNPHDQGALILPSPGNNNQYYLFIRDMDINPNGQPTRVTASLVDMSYNGGLGKIIQRAAPILNYTLSDSRMSACKHANGRDWWLINHEYNTNKIYTQLITTDSIYNPLAQNIGGAGIEPDNSGWSLFSPDGSVFATVTGGMAVFGNGITILDFDRCNGTFSNYRAVKPDTIAHAYFNLAFSPNGRFLYTGNNGHLEQYDLQSSNVPNSGVYLIHDTLNNFGSLVLMPDDKIYIANWSTVAECLSVIDSPDLKAPACAFHLRSVCVPGSTLINNVSNFPNYNLGALGGSGCDTLTALNKGARAAKERMLKVFPNPASDFAVVDYQFTFSNKENIALEITNELGQVVYIHELPIYSGFQKIDISNFANGIYNTLIKRNGQIVATAKFAKQ